MGLNGKISGTEAALLALLTRGEMSGYDLQRAAESAGGFFWSPTKSRIYAVLPQLVGATPKRNTLPRAKNVH